jgi:rubrerythrin
MTHAEQIINEFHQRLKEIDLPNIETKSYDKGETERAVRQAQIAELDAVNTYQQMAQSTKDPKIKELLNDVADEEKVHQGEFQAATDKVDPDNKKEVDKGESEAKEKTLGESLRQFHSEFPELMQEGPVGAAVGAAAKQALSYVPGAKSIMSGYNAAKTGQQQPQAPEGKKPNIVSRALSGVGGIVGAGVGAANAAKDQQTATSNSLHTAGQDGSSILQTALQAITQFASSSVPQQESIRTYEQLRAELYEAYGDEGTMQVAARQKLDTKEASDAATPQQNPPTQQPQAKQDASKKGLMLKAAKQVADAAGKYNGDMAAAAKDPSIAKGITDLITASQQFKVPIPGLEGITADKIQQAVQELSTPAQAGQQPTTGAPAAQVSQAEVQAADPQQAMGLINQIAPRALGNIVKKILADTSNPESKQVAAMIIKATQQ